MDERLQGSLVEERLQGSLVEERLKGSQVEERLKELLVTGEAAATGITSNC